MPNPPRVCPRTPGQPPRLMLPESGRRKSPEFLNRREKTAAFHVSALRRQRTATGADPALDSRGILLVTVPLISPDTSEILPVGDGAVNPLPVRNLRVAAFCCPVGDAGIFYAGTRLTRPAGGTRGAGTRPLEARRSPIRKTRSSVLSPTGTYQAYWAPCLSRDALYVHD